MSKNILITGGAGYIGSHIYLSLIQNNYNPIILDNFSRSNVNIINYLETITSLKVKYESLDIRDKEKVASIINDHEIDVIIHLAAYKSIEESIKKPSLYYNNNVFGLLNLLDALENTKCKNVVFSSSASIYVDDNNQSKLFQENDNLGYKNPYAHTKLICEQIIKEYANKGKINYSILRYFNPAGADDSKKIGEIFNASSKNLFPNIARVASNKKKFLKIFGSNYDTYDGFGVRDYIHISDLADGHILALEYLIKNNTSEVFNLGSGVGYSVMQVLKKYEEISNRKIICKLFPRRDGDSACVLADISKARRILNWIPKKSLAEMCSSSWEWENNNN